MFPPVPRAHLTLAPAALPAPAAPGERISIPREVLVIEALVVVFIVVLVIRRRSRKS